MKRLPFSDVSRVNKTEQINTQIVVAGGGLAGVCAAISAARAGQLVVLIQDRPVLGGNASSEVRLWALGATSHMGNNNRWSREGGIIDEIMLENTRRNKEGNPLIFDTVLLDMVISETNITLLLNTALYQTNKSNDQTIRFVEAFCSQNSIHYQISASQFIDATGDGVLAFNAGASFRVGGECRSEFDERLAPEQESDELLGHTIYFYSKRVGQPVEYVPPSYAHLDVEDTIPRSKIMSEDDAGCRLWWIEYGGIRDTIYETEDIKWELWRIVYGLWNYIKNSGKFENVDDLTLEWIGTVPGKRESRRFEGEYMLNQRDIVEQTQFDDAISYGGWAIDIHPAEGVYSDKPPCSQWHSKGVYQIPYRCFISKDIDNLFFAGRNISATHMAFGSTRVMITCAHGGQAIGAAAAMCNQLAVNNKQLLSQGHIKTLQNNLNRQGHNIPHVPMDLSKSLLASAKIQTSSELLLGEIPFDGHWQPLDMGTAQVLPLADFAQQNTGGCFTIKVKAQQDTQLTAELRVSDKAYNYTPDKSLKVINLDIKAGEQEVLLDFTDCQTLHQYGFVILHTNDLLQVQCSNALYSGVVSVFNKVHKAVSNSGKQEIDPDFGIDSFEFWTPKRRPEGHNIAMKIEPPLACFGNDNLANGYTRPWLKSNVWIADPNDDNPAVTLSWPTAQTINGLTLHFDTDFDHALETIWMGHPEKVMPFCVSDYRVKTKTGKLIYQQQGNYQTVNQITFEQPLLLDTLVIELSHPSPFTPAALFEIDVY